jgi:hypothetical protein
MRQLGLTILSPIDQAQVAALDTLLRSAGDDIENQTLIPFSTLILLHFASWVIFTDGTPGPQLIFESNFDGDATSFLRQLVQKARPALDQIYSHCTDYAAGKSNETVVQYLLAHVLYTDTFYLSCGGFTLTQILQEDELHSRIEEFLGQLPPGTDAAAARRSIQNFVGAAPDLQWASQPAPPYPLRERLRVRDFAILIILLAGLFGPLCLGLKDWGIWLAIVALVLLMLYAILRRKEATDPSISNTPVEDAQPSLAKMEQLVSRENRRPQNHLFSVTTVKPGMFRYALLKVVLGAIEFIGRVASYKGTLSGIPSIHFARWAMINDSKHLLFLSNFDGSWEHYLGEFIDQAAHGLTGVWSNAVNFPRAWNLIQGGATDEQRFKDYARGMQYYTQLWYSAYPFLSVVNVLNNAAIRSGLWGPMDGQALDAWLRRF